MTGDREDRLPEAEVVVGAEAEGEEEEQREAEEPDPVVQHQILNFYLQICYVCE